MTTDPASATVLTPTEIKSGPLHRLKTWPTYFTAIWDGRKTFEVRFDDRGFQTGDCLLLQEWDFHGNCRCHDNAVEGRRINHGDDCARYTGRSITAEVGYVLSTTPPRGSQPGFQGKGYVVMALIEVRLNTREPYRAVAQRIAAGLKRAEEIAATRPGIEREHLTDWAEAPGLEQDGHTQEAANCLASNENPRSSKVTCSPCQLWRLANPGYPRPEPTMPSPGRGKES